MRLTLDDVLGFLDRLREDIALALPALGDPVIIVSVPPGTELDDHLAGGEGSLAVDGGPPVPVRLVEHGKEPDKALVLRLGATPRQARARRLPKWPH